ELAEREQLDQREEDDRDPVGRHAHEPPRRSDPEVEGLVDKVAHRYHPITIGWSAASSRMWRPVYFMNTSSKLGWLICRPAMRTPSPSRRRSSPGMAELALGTARATPVGCGVIAS